MLKEKTHMVPACDLCGTDGDEMPVEHLTFLTGVGYKPSDDDPLAQKFKKLYIETDVCDQCHARIDRHFLGLSTEEKEEMAYACLLSHEERIGKRLVDPNLDVDAYFRRTANGPTL